MSPVTQPVNPAKPALDAADIRFETPGLSAEEVAAVSALLVSAAAEQQASIERSDLPNTSAWMRSRRPTREAIDPGPGAWRSI